MISLTLFKCILLFFLQMLLSEEEVKIKSQIWFAENGDFLKEMEGP